MDFKSALRDELKNEKEKGIKSILDEEIEKAKGKTIKKREVDAPKKKDEKISHNPIAGTVASVKAGAVEGTKSAINNAKTWHEINENKKALTNIENARERAKKAGIYNDEMEEEFTTEVERKREKIEQLIAAQKEKNAISNANLQAVNDRYELGRVGEFAQEAGGALGNMAPSLAVGLVNPAAGFGLMAAQAAAQGYGQALDSGATHEQAALYGVGTGALEAGLERLTGGLSRFYGKGLLLNPVKNSSVKNVLWNTAKGAVGEGAEEAVQGFADPFLQRATYAPDAPNATPEELAHQAAIGAALGGILGGGSNVLDYRGGKKAAERAQDGAGGAQGENMMIDTSAQNEGLNGDLESRRTAENVTNGVNPPKTPYEQAYDDMLRGEDSTKPKAETEDERRVKDFIQSAAVRARMQVEYVDRPLSQKAYYSDGKIYINKNRPFDDAMKVTVAHELYHGMEGTKEHDAIVKLAFEGKDAEAMIAEKIGSYRERGIELDEAGARAEIGADFIERAMTDEATINQVLLENRTLAAKIAERIREIIAVYRAKKTMSAKDAQEYAALLKAKRLYEDGLEKLHEGEYAPAGVERSARYSFLGKNKNGIEVYETSDEIKKLPYKERKNKFLDLMSNEYRGRTAKFTIGNEAYYARFEEDDLGKNIYRDKKSSSNGWKAKINVGASGDIFELIENARYYDSKKESGKKTKAHKGVISWDYFVKQVQIDGRVYNLLANVRKKKDGEYVYSIQLNDNKKIKVSPPVAINDSVSMGAQHSNNNIPNPAENVNSKSQKNEKRFAIDEEKPLYKTTESKRDYNYDAYNLQAAKKYMAIGQKIENNFELERFLYQNDVTEDAWKFICLGYENKDFNVEDLKVGKYLRIGEPQILFNQYMSSNNHAEQRREEGVSVITSSWLHSLKSVFFGAHDNDKLKYRGVYEITGIELPRTGGDDEILIYPIAWAKKTDIKTYKRLEKTILKLESMQESGDRGEVKEGYSPDTKGEKDYQKRGKYLANSDENLQNFMKDSVVKNEDGTPKVVYSGHGNSNLFGGAWDIKKATSGGFYFTENPDIASSYATNKLGDMETYANGDEYRFKNAKGEYKDTIDKVRLNEEQAAKFDAWLEDDMGMNFEDYVRENAPYDKMLQGLRYNGGKHNLQNVYKLMESLGYADNGWNYSTNSRGKSTFEELLDDMGIEWDSYTRDAGGVFPVYLDIKNPIDTSKPFPQDLLNELEYQASKERKASDADSTHWTKDYPLREWVEDIKRGAEGWATQVPAKARKIMLDMGYDGIKDTGGKMLGDTNHTVWVALEPTQIKSATGNRGTFDASKKDIRYSLDDGDAVLRRYDYDNDIVVGKKNGKPITIGDGMTALGEEAVVKQNRIERELQRLDEEIERADKESEPKAELRKAFPANTAAENNAIGTLLKPKLIKNKDSGLSKKEFVERVFNKRQSDAPAEFIDNKWNIDVMRSADNPNVYDSYAVTKAEARYYDYLLENGLASGEDVRKELGKRRDRLIAERNDLRKQARAKAEDIINADVPAVDDGRGGMAFTQEQSRSGESESENAFAEESQGSGNAEEMTGIGFESDSEAKSRYDELIDRYGRIEAGMEPRVDVAVPKQTSDWDKTRRFTRTVLESENISDEAKERIKDSVASDVQSGKFVYNPISNQELQKKANQRIAANGYDGEKAALFAKYRSNERITAEDVATLQQLMVIASDEKLAVDVEDISGLAAIIGTEMGQSIQALSMVKRMSPEGRLRQMQLLRDRLNSKYELSGDEKVEVNKRYEEMLLDKNNSSENMDTIQEYIINDMAQQLPVNMADKFDAWRYLAMLGNPRTHMRNVIGNILNLSISRLNDQLAGIVEAAIIKNGGERTKSAGTVSKELKEFAKADWENNGRKRTDLSNKYGERGQAERNRKIFTSELMQPVEKARKLNERAMDWEDTIFKKTQYIYALSHYMKANNISIETMRNESSQIAERARQYAEQEAYRVTFQEANEFANMLNRLEHKKTDKKSVKALQFGTKALMPFKKTPLNILNRGVEYSPVGLLNGLSDALRLVRKGDIPATQVINEITQGMTGTGVVLLGYFLAEMGLLSSGYDEGNKREQNYENQIGGQNYALTLPNGSYSLDWAAPAAMPLFVGAALHNDIVSRNGGESIGIGDVGHALIKVTDPVLEMSCMDSLQSALESYGNEGATSNMIVSAVKSYALQYVPTLSGQVARSVDDTKRSTYAPKDSKYSKTGESLGRQFMNKVPGLSFENEAAIDVWGRERKQAGSNIVSRAAFNMLSPGTYTPNTATKTDEELKRLYRASGDSGILPKTGSKYITFKSDDGVSKTYYLTAKEYTKYQKKYGGDNFNTVSELMRSNVYKKMSDEEKAAAVKEIYSYNAKMANKEFFKGRGVSYDAGDTMSAKLKDAGGWDKYFAIKNAFPESNYEAAKKRKDKCDKYGIDYTAYAESTDEIKALREANSEKFKKAEESGQKVNKTESNKRAIAKYLASRKDLTDPQRQVIWQEYYNGKTSETYKSVARRYGF